MFHSKNPDKKASDEIREHMEIVRLFHIPGLNDQAHLEFEEDWGEGLQAQLEREKDEGSPSV